MSAKLIEQETAAGQYGLAYRAMVIEQRQQGRLLLVEGFGGMDEPRGGAYRWEHGIVCQLQPGDTLTSLHAEAWNETNSLYNAVRVGRDDSRPILQWRPQAIRALVEMVDWMEDVEVAATDD